MIGHHTIWDIFGCSGDKIILVEPVKLILNTVVQEIDLTKIAESYKQFTPHGASGFILLEESHISIHTWPEHGFAAIDIFSCKEFNIKRVEELLKNYFETDHVITKIINRGILSVNRD